jgi:hypothetical protein
MAKKKPMLPKNSQRNSGIDRTEEAAGLIPEGSVVGAGVVMIVTYIYAADEYNPVSHKEYVASNKKARSMRCERSNYSAKRSMKLIVSWNKP